MEPYWVDTPQDFNPTPLANTLEWLTKPYILSQALKRHCQRLSVEVLCEQFIKAFDEEEISLSLTAGEWPLVRQVLLKGDDTPWTYGRVIVPSVTYKRHFADFAALGSNLLGETMLYHNPLVTRSPFEYTMLDKRHALFDVIYQNLSAEIPKEILCGRRSIFYIQGDPLLVSEFLLPTLPIFE